jgi:predicted nucleic acid-binding protein
MSYVVDASVASRFLLVEDLSDRAELVLDDFLEGRLDLRSPELLVYEVGNTLWKSVKEGFVSLEEAVEKFSYFLELRVDSISLSGAEHKEVLEWSGKNNSTYYDSVYVKSCMKVGGTLLTADDILYKKSREIVPTVHLRDYRD